MIFDWLQANWPLILQIVGGIDVVLYGITKLTPTKWDDNAFAFIHSWVVRIFPPKV